MDKEKELSAACGLFCGACAIYIATQENDVARLTRQSEFLGLTIEETKCNGCRSSRLNLNCTSCKMLSCTNDKEIDFCIECSEYPCEEIKLFQSKYPHRIELWSDLEKIKSIGYLAWFKEKEEHYRCKNCNTINSGWDLRCRKCDFEPSSNYVEQNIVEIHRRLNQEDDA